MNNNKLVLLVGASLLFASVGFGAKRDPLTDPTAKITAAASPVPDPPEEHGEEDELPPAKVPSTVTSKPAPGSKPMEEASHAEAKPDDHGVQISVKPAVAAPKKASPSTVAAPAHSGPKGVPAEQSLKWLMNGNTRYVKKTFRADGRSQADRDRTKTGQHPHAIVLSCADSRVPPEHVFDQGLGEIFTIRVAGQALDSSVLASVEYAVEHLGPRLIIVMGHTKCGAVDAAMKVSATDTAGSDALDKLLAEIRPHLKSRSSEKTSHDLEIESALNADGVARDLVERSALIKSKVEAGELTIKSALYWLDTGRVKFY